MASEVPVVATRVGGVPEVIDHEKDGFLCAVGDVPAMSAASVKLLENPQLRRQMGMTARNHALRSFSADKIVLAYEELYRHTIASAKTTFPHT
jgi:glycosyltransferase involved in cell wall biosynthesis